MSSAIPFPSKREGATARATPALDLPGPRIWTPRHLADFLGLSIHWVYKRCERNAEDPIPRVQKVGRVRFDTQSPAFQEWMRRRLCVDSGEGSE